MPTHTTYLLGGIAYKIADIPGNDIPPVPDHDMDDDEFDRWMKEQEELMEIEREDN